MVLSYAKMEEFPNLVIVNSSQLMVVYAVDNTQKHA